jgi:hypothetical protein
LYYLLFLLIKASLYPFFGLEQQDVMVSIHPKRVINECAHQYSIKTETEKIKEKKSRDISSSHCPEGLYRRYITKEL